MNIKLNQDELNLLIDLVSSIKEATYYVILEDLNNIESKINDIYTIKVLNKNFTFYCFLSDLKTKLCNYSVELQNNLFELMEEN